MEKDEHGIDVEAETRLDVTEDESGSAEAEEARQERASFLTKLHQAWESEERERRAAEAENPDAHRDEEPFVNE